jgi:hypothetical protein
MRLNTQTNSIPFLVIFAVTIVFILGLVISGCKRNDGAQLEIADQTSAQPSSDPSTQPSTTITTNPTLTVPTTASIPPITLTWDAPQTYTNGDPFSAGDLKEYRVYFSTIPGSYSPARYYAVSASMASIRANAVISQVTGTYYFVVTAVDQTGVESSYSNEVSKYIQ